MPNFFCNGKRFSSFFKASEYASVAIRNTGTILGIEKKATPGEMRILAAAALPNGVVMPSWRTNLKLVEGLKNLGYVKESYVEGNVQQRRYDATGAGKQALVDAGRTSMRRGLLKAVLGNPRQRRKLMVSVIIATQAREGIYTTQEQAEAAYDKVVKEKRRGDNTL